MKEISAKTYLLGLTILVYAIALVLYPNKVIHAIYRFFSIIWFVTPSLLLVIIIMFLMNYYINPRKLAKMMKERHGVIVWLITIVAGIISTGPIYLWYPLLSELRAEGFKDSLISAFLYTRAVKLPLLGIMIAYFGIGFTIVLNALIIIVSIFQGIVTEKMMKVRI